jgi:hypothetical protein
VLEDGLHEPISDFRQKTAEPSKRNSKITFYLIISLASVSVLSLLTFLILVVKCVRNSRSSSSCCIRRADSDGYKNPNRNLQLQLNTDGPIKYVEVLGGDMLSQSQSFRSCLSPVSEFSDFTLVKPSSTTDFQDMINVLDASLPDSAWTFESQQVSILFELVIEDKRAIVSIDMFALQCIIWLFTVNFISRAVHCSGAESEKERPIFIGIFLLSRLLLGFVNTFIVLCNEKKINNIRGFV